MKLQVFSILDEKSGVFSAPFVMAQKGQAIRAFGDLVADGKSAIAAHPCDYRLYKIGEWDDVSAAFAPWATPEFQAAAIDFVPSKS